MRQERSVFQKCLLIVCLGVFFVCAAFAVSVQEAESLCAGAVPVEPAGTYRGSGASAGEVVVLAVRVPSPGILALDVSTGLAEAPARIGLLGRGCGKDLVRTGGPETIGRSPAGLLLAVREPGTFLFRLGAQDPDGSLADYRLLTAFAAPAAMEKGENPEEDEPDPGGLRAGPPPSGRCPGGDDHGDTARCATPLVLDVLGTEARLGGRRTGELANGWGDDEDVFELTLSEQRTVVLEVSGDAEPAIELRDLAGQRLALSGGGRIATTLVPGTYFVRVGSAGGWVEGAGYEVSVEAREW